MRLALVAKALKRSKPMNNVIQVSFTKNKLVRERVRKRVFYLGVYYCGPALCQSLEKLWIKRKPNDRWVLQQYDQGRVYELEECSGEDLPAVLDAIPFADEITIDDLLRMGWYHQGEVIYL